MWDTYKEYNDLPSGWDIMNEIYLASISMEQIIDGYKKRELESQKIVMEDSLLGDDYKSVFEGKTRMGKILIIREFLFDYFGEDEMMDRFFEATKGDELFLEKASMCPDELSIMLQEKMGSMCPEELYMLLQKINVAKIKLMKNSDAQKKSDCVIM